MSNWPPVIVLHLKKKKALNRNMVKFNGWHFIPLSCFMLLSLLLPTIVPWPWHRWIHHRWHRILLARRRQRGDGRGQAGVASVLHCRYPPGVPRGQVHYRYDTRPQYACMHRGKYLIGFFLRVKTEVNIKIMWILRILSKNPISGIEWWLSLSKAPKKTYRKQKTLGEQAEGEIWMLKCKDSVFFQHLSEPLFCGLLISGVGPTLDEVCVLWYRFIKRFRGTCRWWGHLSLCYSPIVNNLRD